MTIIHDFLELPLPSTFSCCIEVTHMEIEIERIFNIVHFGALFLEMADEVHLGNSQCKALSQ
jgi:hypothetical protein